MESCTITKILFVLLLTGNFAVSILVGSEEKERKPDQRAEELEWITNFAAARPQDGKVARQANDSPLSSLCPSGITGQFPYPPDCKRFVNCWKGRGMIQVCAPGTLFNPATGECDYPDKVRCAQGEGLSEGPQPWITRFPVARPPIAANLRHSRKDKNNLRTDTITVRPNPGLPPYFGPSHLTRPTPRPTSPTALAKLQEKVECPPGSAGLYPHPTDCTRFLNCWGGRMFVQKCGPGTYFNPDMSVCDHAGAFSCDRSEFENNGQGPPRASEEEGRETKEGDEENKSPEPETFPPEDFFSAGTNLFDVRAGVEDDVEEQTEKSGDPNKEEKTHGETKKERDPSWGKILNFGNGGDRPEGTKLFYDAQGNPVDSNRFWGQTGKTNHHFPKTVPQASPTNYQPVQQPEYKQPHYNNPHSQQNSGFGKPENVEGDIPGEGNAYYWRPHNHVMNRYPPHLQNSWIVKAPVHHNPQSYPQSTKIHGDRPPPISDPHHPTSPVTHYTVPGHFVLVNDKIPTDTRIAHDYHQNMEVPAPFLVPPEPDATVTPSRPTEAKATDLHFKREEPSKVLLPPRPDGPMKGQPFENRSPDSGPTKVDYSGWKPFSGGRVSTYNDSSNGPERTTRRPTNTNDGDWRMHANQEATTVKVPVRQGWTVLPQDANAIDPKDEIIAATTFRPSSVIWPAYHGHQNPYSLWTRTLPPVTRTPEPIATTRAPGTTSTTSNRVYVVYPVKNYENADAGESIIHGVHSQKDKIDSAIKTQKLKGTSHIKKATEEDLKKRIKSEMDFGDSREDLSARDVEMYTPTLEDLFPNAKKDIRLKPLSNHLDGYIEMKKPNGEWGLVCDKDYGWMINEANIVCKELGYGRGAQISWQGYPLDSSSESIPVSVTEVTCNGNEDSLRDCLIIYGDNGCDITKNAVGLRCFDNVTTQCHPEEVEYNNSCYRIVKRDDIDDEGLTLEEAAEYCNKIGGRISDVVSEEENDFISQWLMEKHPEVRSVLTGGIGSAVMGRSLWMWFGSHVPMLYQNWWKGWAEEKKVKHGTVHEPSCVVLRKSYPCFVQEQDEAQIEVELGNVEPEFCSANYFYWDVEECGRLRELKLPYLCKKPLEEIGCVVGRGENYSGTASVTSSGRPCLPWDHPSVKEKLAHQITLQEWSTKLSGHNFCRNLGRQELHPWCFVEGKENSEYCSIPQCWDAGKDSKLSRV